MYIFSFIFYVNKLYFRYEQHITTLRNFNETIDESFHIRYNFFTKQIEHGARRNETDDQTKFKIIMKLLIAR